MVDVIHSRLKLKKFYPLNQFVLLHLLSKILGSLDFMAFMKVKRSKIFFLPNDLARIQIKKFSAAIFFNLCDLGGHFWRKIGFLRFKKAFI